MQKVYECIKDLYLDKYDDSGFYIENKYVRIPKGSMWEIDTHSPNMIASNDCAHLDRVWKSKKAKTHQWIEVTKAHLKEYFAPFDGHWYSVWWIDIDGKKYEKPVYAETPSKATYKAFKQLRDEDGVFEKYAKFWNFIKYYFDKCELKQALADKGV